MKILFISHDASRTGAPIALLNIFQWIRENEPEIKFELLLRRGGPLKEDFEKITRVWEYFPQKYQNNSRIFNRISAKTGFLKKQYSNYLLKLRKEIQLQDFDLIYSNTIVNVDVLELLRPLNIKVVTHVRELNSTIEFFGGAALMKKLKALTEIFIADSEAVKRNLVKEYHYEGQSVEVVLDHINLSEGNLREEKDKIREELNIPTKAFLIGACGGVDWRKGYDLFLNLAAILKYQADFPIYFLWIGRIKEEVRYKIEYDLRKLNLLEKVRFIGVKEEPVIYFSALDVFALMSREEPFGLVGLEAAQFGIPVLCFSETGGMEEFVGTDAGLPSPYLDLNNMAQNILSLYQNPKLVEKLGKQAAFRVREGFTTDIAAKKIMKIVKSIL